MTRIAGVVVAVVAGALLVWTIFAAWGPESLVVPTDGVPHSRSTDNPVASGEGRDSLHQRAQLQRWRNETPAGPGADSSATAQAAASDSEAAPENPDQLVESWLGRRDNYAQILDEPGFIAGRTTLPGEVKGVFEQPEGREWRRVRNDQVTYGGGILVLGVILALALFLAFRGRIKLAEGFSGEGIERFSLTERANHWMTATGFIVAGITGLIVLYGQWLIKPWLGAEAFSTVALAGAYLHMAFAVPFVIGVLVMIALWLVQNLPSRLDWNWLKHGGGFLRDDGEHPPARRFNAGQKLVFWSVVLGGLALLASGLVMMFPFFWTGYDGIQLAQIIHAALGLIMVAIILGHIYIGTIGMEGAFEAMWSGLVDRNWAREHHSLWYREETGEDEHDGGHRRQPAE